MKLKSGDLLFFYFFFYKKVFVESKKIRGNYKRKNGDDAALKVVNVELLIVE